MGSEDFPVGSSGEVVLEQERLLAVARQDDAGAMAAHRLTLDRIAHIRLQVLPLTVALMLAASAVSQQYGLLTNDALVVAVMQAHGLTKLPSHDGDFAWR